MASLGLSELKCWLENWHPVHFMWSSFIWLFRIVKKQCQIIPELSELLTLWFIGPWKRYALETLFALLALGFAVLFVVNLTHPHPDKIAAISISQTIISAAFSWIKIFVFD